MEKPKISILEAIYYLGKQCDGAIERDGQGFMKGHADSYRSIEGVSSLTPEQEKEWYQKLSYYFNTQLSKVEVIPPSNQIILSEEKEKILEKQKEEIAIKIKKETKILKEDPLTISFKFSYNAFLINQIKSIPNRKYNISSQSWEIEIDPSNLELVKNLCLKYKFDSPAQLNSIKFNKEQIKKISTNTKFTKYSEQTEIVEIYFIYDSKLVAEVKQISGRKFHPEKKCWEIKINQENIYSLTNFLTNNKFEVEEKLQNKLINITKEILLKQTQQEENFKKSNSFSSNLEIKGLKGTLRPFQKAGVEYATLNKKVIIGDEMGLGKTVEAIASIHHLNSYPCLVACPNSLKYNWRNEWNNWVDKKVIIINSEDEITEDLNIIEDIKYPLGYLKLFKDGWYERTESGFKKNKLLTSDNKEEELHNPELIIKKISLKEIDVIIVNYNTSFKYQEQFKKIGLKSIIMDESHYLKNNKANRTRALLNLSKEVEVLLQLTGTLIVNRPVELTSQLEILGKLKEFGGWWNFVKRYCNVKNNGFGIDVSGACNLKELHEKLRKICYIRRNKSEVLTELPEKQRTIIEIDISNKREYNKAEREIIEYLKNESKITNEQLREYYKEYYKENQIKFENLLDDQKILLIDELRKHKARNAQNAEHLVQINILKSLCAEGKIEGAIEWINDFLETGEKLVVFGYHIDIINKLAKHFNCNKITGEVKIEDRQKCVDDFQTNPETKLILLNLQAGGVGLTLTKSSNVLFLEQGWTPGEHDQAEDRIHRIGQKNAVNCWYLLGKNTIDNDIYDLISEKRKVTNAVNAGIEDNTKVNILSELVKKLINK